MNIPVFSAELSLYKATHSYAPRLGQVKSLGQGSMNINSIFPQGILDVVATGLSCAGAVAGGPAAPLAAAGCFAGMASLVKGQADSEVDLGPVIVDAVRRSGGRI